MAATTTNRVQPATRRNPLRTYQFRVGLLPTPSDPDGSGAAPTPTGYVAGVVRS
jgi:hypothetical protein